MKRYWPTIVFALAAMLWAQSKVDLSTQVTFPRSEGYELAGWKAAALKRIRIGPGLTVTEAGGVVTISAQPGISNVWMVENPTVSGAEFSLNYLPITGSVMISRNGILLSPGIDYSISGKTIALVSGNAPQTGDIFRCQYEYQNP